MKIDVEDIHRIRVEPGEALWIRIPDLRRDAVEQVRSAVNRLLPDVKVIITPDNVELSVVAAG